MTVQEAINRLEDIRTNYEDGRHDQAISLAIDALKEYIPARELPTMTEYAAGKRAKPVVYNYRKAEDKIDALKDLLRYMAGRIEKLEAENDKLYRENRNLVIRLRIEEADR